MGFGCKVGILELTCKWQYDNTYKSEIYSFKKP